MQMLSLLVLALLALRPPQSGPLTVFAASDLGPAFKEIVPQFEAARGTDVTLVLGSTGVLTQQIRNGAPADAFFAANERFVHDLASESLTVRESHAIYARGRIAIVALKANRLATGDIRLLSGPAVRRVAIANPQHAPYGLAAQQALQAAGLWTAVEPKLVFGENVQQAVQFVRSGSAEMGIVARSVADTPDLSWTLVDSRLHAPLNQMAAVIARSRQPEAAAAFIAFVTSAQGRAVMQRYGFF